MAAALAASSGTPTVRPCTEPRTISGGSAGLMTRFALPFLSPRTF
jgi:hypothetical protein